MAFDPHQAAARGEQLLPLLIGQRFPVQAELHLEVHHRLQSEPGGAASHAHLHLRARRLLRAPPVGNAHHHAARLQRGDLLEKLISLARTPGEGIEDLPGIDQRLEPGTALGRLVHRHQQIEQRVPVSRPGIFLERAAERQVLHSRLLRYVRRVSRQKRERRALIALVLREVEVHSPGQAPARVQRLQPRLHIAAGGSDLLARGRMKLLPPHLQALHIEILGPGERRQRRSEPLKLGARRRHFGRGPFPRKLRTLQSLSMNRCASSRPKISEGAGVPGSTAPRCSRPRAAPRSNALRMRAATAGAGRSASAGRLSR